LGSFIRTTKRREERGTLEKSQWGRGKLPTKKRGTERSESGKRALGE